MFYSVKTGVVKIEINILACTRNHVIELFKLFEFIYIYIYILP